MSECNHEYLTDGFPIRCRQCFKTPWEIFRENEKEITALRERVADLQEINQNAVKTIAKLDAEATKNAALNDEQAKRIGELEGNSEGFEEWWQSLSFHIDEIPAPKTLAEMAHQAGSKRLAEAEEVIRLMLPLVRASYKDQARKLANRHLEYNNE
jgi:chromosome segregation ATPase